MADAQNPVAANAPALDGGAANPALELPAGDPAANTDPSAPAAADPAAANPPADPAAADPNDPSHEPPAAKERVRFGEMQKMVRQAVQAAEESKQQLHQALQALERVAPVKPADAPAPQEEQEPEAPVFETPEQYQRDMADYARKLAQLTAKRQVQAERAEAERARVEGEQRAYQQRVRDSLAAGRVAAMQEIPDFAEVAESPDVSISVPMANAIALLEHQSKGNGTKVWYFLGKNPAEAARIAALPPADQLLEMGMLVPKALAALAPKAAPRTNAPPPIRPLGGGATPASKSADDMSMEEYAAMRNKR